MCSLVIGVAEEVRHKRHHVRVVIDETARRDAAGQMRPDVTAESVLGVNRPGIAGGPNS